MIGVPTRPGGRWRLSIPEVSLNRARFKDVAGLRKILEAVRTAESDTPQFGPDVQNRFPSVRQVVFP